ncbi:MAG: TonB-dependent receptor [Bacteroidales bacterium]|nr:TonB-dependent receptor [Bacteroidales bacterium]
MKQILSFFAGLVLLGIIPTQLLAQSGFEVKGVVSDETGPVIGATILEQGTTVGTSTDLDGQFALTVSSGDATIEISCIGYKSLTFKANSMPVNITLEEDALFLDDVVVIGYGTVKKSDLTGSVSTVKADDVNKGMISSPSQLLQGKAGGVVVTPGSGQPGAASTIRIRGGSSLSASNDPMLIIDGLPISNTGVSGVSDQLSTINPDDIESFTVLKDASATAIYGSRASNGVIIITTKKGSKGESTKPNISIDFTASLQQNAKYLDVLNGDEMRSLIGDLYGYDSAAYAAQGKANTNWQKEVYRLGQTYDTNISISGRAGKGTKAYMPYRVSAGYYDQTGTLKTSAMQRGTVSVGLTPTFFDNHLTINLNAKGTYMHNRFANQDAIYESVQYDPTQPVHDYSATGLNGYRVWNGPNPGVQGTGNPVAALYEKEDLSNAYRFTGNAQIDYKVHGAEDLHFNLNLGLDYSSSKGTVNIPYGSEQSYKNTTQNGLGLNESYTGSKRDETLEFYGAYDHTWNKKHTFGAMVGYSYQWFYNDSTDQQLTDLAEDDPDFKEYYSSISKFEYYLISFFGRVNYNFDERYFITGTVRWDGTSRFVNNKWGFFPSVALAWNIKNEPFMENASPKLSALKLRLSWGQTGQQDLNTSSYPSLATYISNDYDGSRYFFGNNMLTPLTPSAYNADLKWETTTSYNVGLDLGFVDQRVTFGIDAYYRKTTDLLNYTPIAAGSNLSNYINANIGTLENTGVELDANFIPVQTKDWFWQIGLNGAWNKNKVTKLTANDSDDYTGVETGGISGGTGNNIQRFMTGYPAYTYYVYQQIYDTDGNPIPGAYVDRNGDGTIDESDKYYYKDPNPDFTIGFNTTLQFKNWTLAISAHSNIGNYVYNNNASNMCLTTDLWTNNFTTNRIKSEAYSGFNTAEYFSDYWVRNASFFKLDNITLGYLFHLNDGETINLFATVQNVCCASPYDGLDPEIFGGIDNNIWPRPRTYIVGLKFNF